VAIPAEGDRFEIGRWAALVDSWAVAGERVAVTRAGQLVSLAQASDVTA
jgi:hypothetical protein